MGKFSLANMGQNQKIFTVIIGVLLCVGIITGTKSHLFKDDGGREAVRTSRQPALKHIAARETTLKEAIDLAYVKARHWSPHAKLIAARSTDAADDPTQQAGSQGTRHSWNIDFTDTTSTHEYNVFITGGRVAAAMPVEEGDNRIIEDSDLKLDSASALRIAVQKKKLKPGDPRTDWAVGYHFVLGHAAFSEMAGKDLLIIEVVGISPHGNFARVDIDEGTGRIVYAGEKIRGPNGRMVWRPF